MCASVSAETYTCLCLCVINHCLTLYRTHNARALFTPLKINSSTSDMLTILRRENCSILLTQLQQKKLPERYMCSVLQGRGESGNLKMNVARGSSRASIQKRHGNTATLELVNNSCLKRSRSRFQKGFTLLVAYHYEQHTGDDASWTLQSIMKCRKSCNINRSDSGGDCMANNVQLTSEQRLSDVTNTKVENLLSLSCPAYTSNGMVSVW